MPLLLKQRGDKTSTSPSAIIYEDTAAQGTSKQQDCPFLCAVSECRLITKDLDYFSRHATPVYRSDLGFMSLSCE